MGWTACFSRTNWFHVVNEEKFRAWVDECGFTLDEDRHKGLFALRPGEFSDDGRLDTYYDAELNDIDDPCEDELLVQLAKFLSSGSIAVLLEAGGDSHGTVFGQATAINAEGKLTRTLTLYDIADVAERELGARPTI